MKYINSIWFIVFFIFIEIVNCPAQTYEQLITQLSLEVDIADRIPPLAELQEKAIENSPIFRMLDADVKIGDYKIKEEQRLWLHSVGIEGSARYGLFDNLIITQDLGLTESATHTTKQGRYFLGFYAKIPLSDIIDKSNVKTAIAERDKLHYQREARIQELRELIIVRYNNVLKEYKGMIIKLNAVENYRVQQLRADEDFKNGVINVYEKARLEDMLSKSVIELEESKLDFLTAFQVLEEMVGVKINLIN
jgi:outer membrane protein TolC